MMDQQTKDARRHWYMLKAMHEASGKTPLFMRAYRRYVERFGKPGKEPPGEQGAMDFDDVDAYFNPNAKAAETQEA